MAKKQQFKWILNDMSGHWIGNVFHVLLPILFFLCPLSFSFLVIKGFKFLFDSISLEFQIVLHFICYAMCILTMHTALEKKGPINCLSYGVKIVITVNIYYHQHSRFFSFTILLLRLNWRIE